MRDDGLFVLIALEGTPTVCEGLVGGARGGIKGWGTGTLKFSEWYCSVRTGDGCVQDIH